MSLYDGEKEAFFNQAIKSIWQDSTLKPDEIVLVIDGPIREDLLRSVNFWEQKIPCLKTIFLDKNVGLGSALRIGLINCSTSIIARMDTDDISVPSRFKKQISLLSLNPSIDVVGGWIAEFITDPSIIDGYRKLPEKHLALYKLSKWRDPVNHMTVMFRKEAVIKAGNYETLLWFEDTWLWARMIMNDCKFYNIQESLVLARAGTAMHARRRGLKYLLSEIALIRKLYKIKFLNLFEAISNIIIRAPIRLLPARAVGFIFKHFLRTQE